MKYDATKPLCPLVLGIALAVLAACDDTTDTIGIYTDADDITSTTSVFEGTTCSFVADSVLSNSNSSYLGSMTDPETGLLIKAEFLAQFYSLEDYGFPDYDLMVKNDDGEIEADSIEIRLYYSSYYGEDNNPLKMEVWELDTANVLREDTSYYSNSDLTCYINAQADEPLATRVFTATDFTLTEDSLESDYYAANIRVMLPKEYGTFIINKYYENNSFFKNSYNFIRHVCPGFYFKLTDGNGTMIKMKVGALNVYFTYLYEDSLTTGMVRFSATPEVIQCTNVENEGLHELVENERDVTFLKTPAGVFTEMTLPIADIYDGHENDSISQTQFILYRYNAEDMESPFDIPDELLLVRKQDMYTFFENRDVSDDETSFVTSFNSSYNTYTFANISKLVAYCYNEREHKADSLGMSVEEWSEVNEDWNKIMLIPVETSEDNSSNVVSVTHDMGLGSTRLVGGEGSNIEIQVIYSSFE